MVIANWTTMRAVFAIVAAPLDPDGLEPWPLAKVRLSGFSGGFSGISKPIQAFPIDISVDYQANGVEAYDAYLSQRTDTPALQWLAMVRKAGKSGTYTVSLTAAYVTYWQNRTGDIAFTSTSQVTEDQVVQLLKHATFYIQRHSDDAIQLVQLLPYTLGTTL